ncbi:hypothetical protein TSUD_11040 [Trifolium subterraneum]|nr:hypothetical protein TSUD_11040 [Trifolium subterraneum]
MAKIALRISREATKPDCIQALIVEFIVTFLYVFAGVGSTMAARHISGGHLNPSVTLGLLVGGHITIVRAILYWIVQLIASSTACYLLHYLTTGLPIPTHTLGSGIGYTQGVVWEMGLTFSLLFTVYATMVDPKKGGISGLGPLLIGFVVGANIMAGGAFSAASTNPARSFGPALVSGNWTNHWVYWVGPLIGSGLAGFIYENFFINRDYVPLAVDEERY